MSNTKKSGMIGVQSENMFPIIKKFLYSDHEIFLRELVSNAVDACQKLRTLSNRGEYDGSVDDLKVEVKIEGDRLIISDNGIGMSAAEIDRYINEIAISGAEEFVEKYKDNAESIIGHFGLGFYSSFMVSDKVEIYTQSYREDEPSMRWTCEGDPEYTMEEAEKRERGTDIILYIDEESKEFLEPTRIRQLLTKYSRFLPIPIIMGKKTEWKDGEEVETDEDFIINDAEPIWTKAPMDLTDEDYINFYQLLYPMNEPPMFWVHLNIDYPFELTGILYFPRIKTNSDFSRDKIHLYSNQVFVTDSVEGIVPEFLMLLHGVIDSPDIPLNVSRSYLQSDSNVKKISRYITRKVADKLTDLFEDERKEFEEKWPVLELFVKLGMLTDDRFYDKAKDFLLLKNREGNYYSLDEYRDLVAANQTDKDGNVVYLYAEDLEREYSFIEAAKAKGYDVLHLDGQLDLHLIQMLETKLAQTLFVRVDSNTVDKLILKDEAAGETVAMTPEQETIIKGLFEAELPANEAAMFHVDVSHQGAEQNPIVFVQNEQMRRMKDMAKTQQGMEFIAQMPDSYTVMINLDHDLIQGALKKFEETKLDDFTKLQTEKSEKKTEQETLQTQLNAEGLGDDEKETLQADRAIVEKELLQIDEKLAALYSEQASADATISQLIDLGLLGSNLLKGAELESFIKRSIDLL